MLGEREGANLPFVSNLLNAWMYTCIGLTQLAIGVISERGKFLSNADINSIFLLFVGFGSTTFFFCLLRMVWECRVPVGVERVESQDDG